jgi:hypothetical protein
MIISIKFLTTDIITIITIYIHMNNKEVSCSIELF